MAVQQVYVLKCDSCSTVFKQFDELAAEVRERAEESKWVTSKTRGGDLCPNCQVVTKAINSDWVTLTKGNFNGDGNRDEYLVHFKNLAEPTGVVGEFKSTQKGGGPNHWSDNVMGGRYPTRESAVYAIFQWAIRDLIKSAGLNVVKIDKHYQVNVPGAKSPLGLVKFIEDADGKNGFVVHNHPKIRGRFPNIEEAVFALYSHRHDV